MNRDYIIGSNDELVTVTIRKSASRRTLMVIKNNPFEEIDKIPSMTHSEYQERKEFWEKLFEAFFDKQ